MSQLKSLATKENSIVIASIHQPSKQVRHYTRASSC